jgi:putative CocE/NonD family hydrolase
MQLSAELHADAVNVPIYQVAGWYDLFLGGTLKHYLAFKTRGGEIVRPKQWLMIGPWNHGPLTGKPGDVDFGPTSRGNMEALTVRWFDYILKDIDNGIGGEKSVKVFVALRRNLAERAIDGVFSDRGFSIDWAV